MARSMKSFSVNFCLCSAYEKDEVFSLVLFCNFEQPDLGDQPQLYSLGTDI